jgi:hypothetical protein
MILKRLSQCVIQNAMLLENQLDGFRRSFGK